MTEPAPHPASRYVLPAILLAGLVIYGPLLAAGFAWDDQMLVLDLEERRAGGLGSLFTSDLWAADAGEGPTTSSYYRPLTSLDFHLLHRLVGPSPFAFHALSVALHLLTAGLLFGLLRRLCERETGPGLPWIPALGTLLFLFHPLQQEAVAFVSARNDLWAGLACVVAARLWLSDRVVATAGVLFVGLLFKETALAIVCMAALFDLVGRRLTLRRLGPLLAAVALYAGLRVGVAGVAGPSVAFAGADVVAYLAHWTSAVLLPLEVGPYRPLVPVADAAWPIPVVVLVIGGLITASWSRPTALPGLGLAAAALALAFPVSAHLGFTGDRYAYVAILGVALALPALLGQVARCWLIPKGVFVIVVLVALNASSMTRWQDHASLMRHGQAADPTGRASFELAKSLSSTGDYEGAREAARRAIREPYRLAAALPLLAAMELSLGDPEAALTALDDARAAGLPDDAPALVNRAASLRHLGRQAEAEPVIQHLGALMGDPAAARARVDRLAAP